MRITNTSMSEETKRMAGYFLVAALFVSFSAGLAIADSFSTYRSVYTVLVVPAGDGTTLHEVAENVATLTGTSAVREAYFDALGTETIRYEDLAGKAQADTIGQMTEVTVPSKGSQIVVSGSADNQDDATMYAKVMTDTVVRFAERYYNIRTEAQFRIVEGPVTTKGIGHPVWFVLASIAIGLAVTATFFSFLFLLPRLFSLGKRSLGERSIFRPDVFEPKKPTDTFQLPAESRDEVVIPEMPDAPIAPVMPVAPVVPVETPVAVPTAPRVSVTKAHAPMNLPGFSSSAEEAFLREFSFVGEEKIDLTAEAAPAAEDVSIMNAVHTTPESDEPAEPDEEEYKRRLNQLLKGKL